MPVEIERFVLSSYQSNCYLVTHEGSALIIDPGEASPELLDAARVHQVASIFLTHAHPDHIGGIPALREAGIEAPVQLHRDDLPLWQSLMGEDRPVEQWLSGGETIGLEGLEFEVMHTPGHSPGSVILIARSEGIIFTGDLLFAGSIGRTDFPGGSDSQMERSLGRIVKLEGEWVLYPGHGPQTSLAQERWTNPMLIGF